MPVGAGILGTALLGYLGSKEQGKINKAGAGPVTTGPPPWLEPYLKDLLDQGVAAGQAPLPDFPDFLPFNPDLSGLAYSPLATPNIPGASAASKGILRRIMELIDSGSPALEAGNQAVKELLSGESNQFYPIGESLLTSGPLLEGASGKFLQGGNPFEQEVVDLAREDYNIGLDRRLAQIESDASGVNLTGSPQVVGELKSRAVDDASRGFNRQAAELRASNFESERDRMGQSQALYSSLLSSLAGLRSGDIRTAGSIAPSLEAARFTGPGLAGGLSTNIDQLGQAASMFEANFGANQHALQQQYQALAAELGARYGAANAQGQNQFNLSEFGFDLESPFLRNNQLAQLLLPLARLFSQTQGQYYEPNPLYGALSGIFGGLLTGAGLGAFGGAGGD